MAIRDLLWACPVCRTFSSIRDGGRSGEVCTSCGTRFRRGSGATIQVTRPGGARQIRSPAELEDALPSFSEMPLENGRLGPAPAIVRVVRSDMPIAFRGEYLGRAESFGPRISGTVTLDERTLAVGIPEAPMVWPIESITAVQPSSAAIQINSRIHPLASIRFVEQSVRLWEAALHDRIRHVYAGTGRGRVTQFHPRIRVARAG